MKYKINILSIYEKGHYRDTQEDNIYPPYQSAKAEDRLFMVCDGMGGHEAGEVASQAVCEAMSRVILELAPGEEVVTSEIIGQALTEAYDLLDERDPNPESMKKMGTTMTLLKLHAKGATIAHIGDSRVYQLRPDKEGKMLVAHKTRDHSLVNDLLKVGELKPEEVESFPRKNVITRAMQSHMERRPKADVTQIEDVRAGDYFLLCSDGMLEHTSDENLCYMIGMPEADDEKKAKMLLETTNDNKDNHSAYLIHILEAEETAQANPIYTNSMMNINPWIGLRPYSEGDILYGRDDDTARFMKMLLAEQVVVLGGQSGVGKTSFIHACVCPLVREHGIIPVIIRLLPDDYHLSHISQITQSIYETLNKLPDGALINEMYPLQDGETETILSFFKRHRIEDCNGQIIKPLIVLDQFEQMLFRNYFSPIYHQIDESISYDFKDEEGNDCFPFYIIICVREDFVSKIDTLFNSNKFRLNRFYLRELNGEQAYRVITNGGKVNIDEKTVLQILKSISGRENVSIDGILEIHVSPILLSLYMNRLYDKCLKINQSTITEDIVNSYNGVDIISELYDEATEKLSRQTVDYLEDMLLTFDNRRNNISEVDFVREGYVKKEELEILVRYNIIRRFSYLDDIRIELSSDIFCPIIERRISERNYRHILYEQHESVTKISFTKRFVESFFNFKNNDEERDPLDEYVPKKVDYEIFISYRREDGRDHARNIQQALKAQGYKRIFFDYDSIQKGEFSKRIIDAIYSCTDFILVLSPKSMKRCAKKGDPVANEIRTALKYGKHIIPVTIDGKEVKWPRAFPEDLQFIKGLQFHDHKSDSYFEHSIEELCNKLTCKKSEEIM